MFAGVSAWYNEQKNLYKIIVGKITPFLMLYNILNP